MQEYNEKAPDGDPGLREKMTDGDGPKMPGDPGVVKKLPKPEMIRNAAREYARAGLSVIPVDPKTKQPIGSWKRSQTQALTPEQISGMDLHGIGIVCGAVSGGLECLDFDHKARFGPAWRDLVEAEQPGLVDRLTKQRTQSDGRHIVYRCPAVTIPGNMKLAHDRIPVSGPGDHDHEGKKYPAKQDGGQWFIFPCLIESRGEGGQFVADPSPGYEVLNGSFTDVPKITAPERETLINAARALDRGPATKPRQEPKPETDGTRPGDDYNETADPWPILERHGWTKTGITKGDREWLRRPGKETGWSASLNGGKVLMVFSTNAAPFEAEKSYSPFAILALLDHGGDFAAAAREIRKIRTGCEDGKQGGSREFAEFANSQGTNSNDDEWNDLLLIPEWPELDDRAMPGAIGEFVELASRNSEADRAAILGSFLVGLSAQCGPSSFLQVGDTSHFPRINVVICGASSKARKGTSYGPVSRLFRPMDNLWIPAQTSPGPLSTGEGLVYRVRDERKQQVTDKKTGQTKVEVVDPGVSDKRLLVVDQELAAALNSMKRQGNTLSTIIRSLWDNGNCDPLTKNNPIKCTDAHVCILCHITIAELIKLIDDVELLNGLANRKLWILARRGDPVPFPEPMPREELDPLRRYFQHNAEKARMGGEMALTAGAKELWASVYPELSRDHEGIVGSVLNRMEAQALRLSMVYALATGCNLIEAKHIQQSLAFLDYCKQSTIKIFTKKADDGLQGKIIEALKGGPLDRTGLHRALNNHAKASDLKEAIKKLCEKGVIVAKEETPKGKVLFTLANLRKVRKPRNHKAPDIRTDCEECEFSQDGPEQTPAPDVEVF